MSPTHIKEAERNPGPLKTPGAAITLQASWHTVVELDAVGTLFYIYLKQKQHATNFLGIIGVETLPHFIDHSFLTS